VTESNHKKDQHEPRSMDPDENIKISVTNSFMMKFIVEFNVFIKESNLLRYSMKAYSFCGRKAQRPCRASMNQESININKRS
jgi:hypothetical protein